MDVPKVDLILDSLFLTAYFVISKKCILKFGSWSYHGLSLDIYHSGPGDTEAFTDNGEWV